MALLPHVLLLQAVLVQQLVFLFLSPSPTFCQCSPPPSGRASSRPSSRRQRTSPSGSASRPCDRARQNKSFLSAIRAQGREAEQRVSRAAATDGEAFPLHPNRVELLSRARQGGDRYRQKHKDHKASSHAFAVYEFSEVRLQPLANNGTPAVKENGRPLVTRVDFVTTRVLDVVSRHGGCAGERGLELLDARGGGAENETADAFASCSAASDAADSGSAGEWVEKFPENKQPRGVKIQDVKEVKSSISFSRLGKSSIRDVEVRRRLTKNQEKAYPLLERNGGIVLAPKRLQRCEGKKRDTQRLWEHLGGSCVETRGRNEGKARASVPKFIIPPIPVSVIKLRPKGPLKSIFARSCENEGEQQQEILATSTPATTRPRPHRRTQAWGGGPSSTTGPVQSGASGSRPTGRKGIATAVALPDDRAESERPMQLSQLFGKEVSLIFGDEELLSDNSDLDDQVDTSEAYSSNSDVSGCARTNSAEFTDGHAQLEHEAHQQLLLLLKSRDLEQTFFPDRGFAEQGRESRSGKRPPLRSRTACSPTVRSIAALCAVGTASEALLRSLGTGTSRNLHLHQMNRSCISSCSASSSSFAPGGVHLDGDGMTGTAVRAASTKLVAPAAVGRAPFTFVLCPNADPFPRGRDLRFFLRDDKRICPEGGEKVQRARGATPFCSQRRVGSVTRVRLRRPVTILERIMKRLRI